MTIRRDVNNLLNRLAAAEEQFRANEFLAPALPGGVVHVRVADVLLRLRVSGFIGWGIFRPAGSDRAQFVRRATRAERRRYLEHLPSRRLILCDRHDHGWQAWPASRTDARFPACELVPVHLVEYGRRFDTIDTRFDGIRCWYDDISHCDSPAAAYLRESFDRGTPTFQLVHPGLTPEQLDAYARADDLWRLRDVAVRTLPEEVPVTAACGLADCC